jgi:hypothetical protein
MIRIKWFSLLVVILCLLWSCAYAEELLPFSNGLTWLSTVEDVIAAERLSESDIQTYDDLTQVIGSEMKINGYSAQSMYVFIKDRLRISGFEIQMDTSNTEATEAIWKSLMETNHVNAPLSDDEAKEKIGEFVASFGSRVEWPENFRAMETADGILVMALTESSSTYAIAYMNPAQEDELSAEDFVEEYTADQREPTPMLYTEFAGVPCDVPIEEAHISCFNYHNVNAKQFTDYGIFLAKRGYAVTGSAQETDIHTYTITDGTNSFEIRYDNFEHTLQEIWRFERGITQTIDASGYYTIALRTNGKVVAAGDDPNEQYMYGWHNILSVAALWDNAAGMKADGTAVLVGSTDEEWDVSGWRDLVAIEGSHDHVVGLKSDGTVVAAGKNDDGACDVSDWTDIVAVAAGSSFTMGLKSDGTVVSTGGNDEVQNAVKSWTNVVSIAAGFDHAVGLNANGTVVAAGQSYGNECDVSGWTDITAIAAGSGFTIGLKADGTMVAIGLNDEGQCNISGWTDIVAVAAGYAHTVGLKGDGTVVAEGLNINGQCNVEQWRDIAQRGFQIHRDGN